MNSTQVDLDDASTVPLHGLPAGSLSDINLFTFNLWFVVVATSCLACFSIVANLINSCVFPRQGLSERVNVTLLCLSVTDVLASVSALGFTASYSGKLTPFANLNIDVLSLLMIFAWIRAFFIDLSSALTVYITIERSICVTFPLSFKTSIVARRSKVILATTTLFVFVNYIPIYATLRSTYANDTNGNSTILTLVYTDLHLSLGLANDFLFGIALAVCCQISVFTCAVLMYLSLRKSTELRDKQRMVHNGSPANHFKSDPNNPGLPKREKRVVRMILMLACLYIPTSLPQIVFSCIRVGLPGLFVTSRNIYDAIGAVVKMCTTANGAFNIFIYYHFSSRYK
ncbi:unnamed protein product, partial [Lymnaea stagnalis]